MKRDCFVLKSSRNYGSDLNRHICIDLENQGKIINALKGKENIFWQIVERILTQNFIYWDCFTCEKKNNGTEYSGKSNRIKSNDVSVIRFFDVENTLLYCVELSTRNGSFYVICSVEFTNSTVQLDENREMLLIEKLSGYEYKIINEY